MGRPVLTLAVVFATAFCWTSGALAGVGGEEGVVTAPAATTSPDPAPSPDAAASTTLDPATDVAPPAPDEGSAPAGSTDPDPVGGVTAPPAEEPVPPLPAGEVPTPPLPAPEVPTVEEPPPTLPDATLVVPPPPDAETVANEPRPPSLPVSAPFSGSDLTAGDLTVSLASTLASLRGARDQSQGTRTRGRAGSRHELRPPLPNDLLRSGSPFRQVGGSVSGGGSAAGASFSPDTGARVLGSVLLLALMGAGLIVSTRATVPSSLVALVRLERPG